MKPSTETRFPKDFHGFASCKIMELKDNEIALNLDDSFLGYYDFVKEVIGSASEDMRSGFFGPHIVATVIQIGDVRIKIGMLKSLYYFDRNQGKPASRILDLLESEVDNNVNHLFGDGIYLEVQGTEWGE